MLVELNSVLVELNSVPVELNSVFVELNSVFVELNFRTFQLFSKVQLKQMLATDIAR